MVSHPRWRCLPPTLLSRATVNSAGAYIRVGVTAEAICTATRPPIISQYHAVSCVGDASPNQSVVPEEVDLRMCPLSNGSYVHWLAADLPFSSRPRSRNTGPVTSCRSARRLHFSHSSGSNPTPKAATGFRHAIEGSTMLTKGETLSATLATRAKAGWERAGRPSPPL